MFRMKCECESRFEMNTLAVPLVGAAVTPADAVLNLFILVSVVLSQ